MRIAIIYAPQYRKLEDAAKVLGKTIEAGGHQVDYFYIGKGDRSPSVRRYDVVYVGSIAEGTFGGKVPAEISTYLSQCRGFQNNKSAAFMIKRLLGNTKGLKRLMGVLENLGSQVVDFQTIGGKSDAESLGKRLRG